MPASSVPPLVLFSNLSEKLALHAVVRSVLNFFMQKELEAEGRVLKDHLAGYSLKEPKKTVEG